MLFTMQREEHRKPLRERRKTGKRRSLGTVNDLSIEVT